MIKKHKPASQDKRIKTVNSIQLKRQKADIENSDVDKVLHRIKNIKDVLKLDWENYDN
jgi:hypothetical protein